MRHYQRIGMRVVPKPPTPRRCTAVCPKCGKVYRGLRWMCDVCWSARHGCKA